MTEPLDRLAVVQQDTVVAEPLDMLAVGLQDIAMAEPPGIPLVAQVGELLSQQGQA